MNNKPYYMQWNVDVHGTPISIHREEKHQVSSVYFDIKLEEIPDEYQRLIVKDSSGVMLHEVVDFDKLSSASYFVDYNNGVVYFHQDNGGAVFSISYYGRGFRRIPANRIVMSENANTKARSGSVCDIKSIDDLCDLVLSLQQEVIGLREELNSIKA